MASPPFSVEVLSFGGEQDQSNSTNRSYESMEVGNGRKKGDYGAEDYSDSLSSDYGCYQGQTPEQGLHFPKYQQQEQSFSGYGLLDDLRVDIMSPPLQTCLDEIAKLDEVKNGVQYDAVSKKETQKKYPFSLASLELLKTHGGGLKRYSCKERMIERTDVDPPCTEAVSQKLSTEEIMRLAAARFIQSSTQMNGESMLNNPYDLAFSGLSDDEVKNVELVELLFASAEKVGDQQFESASRLLNHCDYSSSSFGNAVERVVYYFSKALQERIDRETGRTILKGLQEEQSIDIYEAMMAPSSNNISFHQGIPFPQISHFAGIQAIIDSVAEAKRIHVIDLEIRTGPQWTIFMQALLSRHKCPVELLKITAMGTTSKQLIENTGKRLMSFAQSMNLPLSFHIVMLSDMLELKEDAFELDSEETIAVFSEYLLTSFIAPPNRLDSIMKVIRKINPCIMVICEVEANHNSPAFVNRFTEALFYISAYFDCLATCMEQDDQTRMFAESTFFGEGIKKVLAAEGEERNIRNVKIDVWRTFFARFGMEETELSMSSLYQANLVLKNFPCGRFCTLKMDGKSLVVGWKGTPIHSLSAWKFI